MMKSTVAGVLLLLAARCTASPPAPEEDAHAVFVIKVVDVQTGRGVPLVELQTTNAISYVTDSRGVVAFHEPGLMNQRVFFTISSHGYEFLGKVFDARGVTLKTVAGDSALLRVRRTNIAERLYRTTGQGIYDHSVRAGYHLPIRHPLLNGRVMGQDGGVGIVYRRRIYWFWGDTGCPFGPLGNFGSSGAISELPENGGLDPSVGIDYTYFVDSSGFSRPMVDVPGPGMKWLGMLMTVPDTLGRERLLAWFMRVNGLVETYERGLVSFDDSTETFRRLVSFDSNTVIAFDGGSTAFRVNVGGVPYYYIAALDDLRSMYRVRADWAHITNPSTYEQFSCLTPGSVQASATTLDRDGDGRLRFAWKARTGGVTLDARKNMTRTGDLRSDEAWLVLEDIATGKPLRLHSGTIEWNEHRRRWVMLVQQDMGEVWFAEADTPTGPWTYARMVVSHDDYNFYLPRQHPFFDQESGRLIYFEGCYSNMFSGNPQKTPRYDYNQIMYRLDLADRRLALPAPVYLMKTDGGETPWRMRETIDSLNLWSDVAALPFYAVPPSRITNDLIPVYLRIDEQAVRLVVDTAGATAASPAFLALPSDTLLVTSRDPISGTWSCLAQSSGSADFPFTLELDRGGDSVVVGPEITSGLFSSATGILSARIDDYVLEGQLVGDSLTGTFASGDGSESGTWAGTRTQLRQAEPVSPSVVPLWEYYVRHTSNWYYSTDSTLSSDEFRRSEKPVCRVWKNPSSLLPLDYDARPVPVVVR